MADTPPADGESKTPKMVQMPQAVHEITTGKNKVIEPGTLITDDVVKEHKLATKDVDRLVGTGALKLVGVLKD